MSEPTVSIVRRSELRPGDMLVLSTKAFLTDEMIERLQQQARGIVPAGVKIMVIDGGVDISSIIGMTADTQEGRVL